MEQRYTPLEVQQRFTAWARMPRDTDVEISRRHVAWCMYVDARDNLPEGTTQSSVIKRVQSPETQISLFH